MGSDLVVAIDPSRVVPVTVDLTTQETNLQILRGIENAQRVDQPQTPGLSLVAGEWGVLNADGTIHRATSSSQILTFLCFCGTDRFDAAATGNVTMFQNSNLLILSSFYDTNGMYAVGTNLTVKDTGGGFSAVTPAASGDYINAVVVTVGTNYLVYEVVASPTVLA